MHISLTELTHEVADGFLLERVRLLLLVPLLPVPDVEPVEQERQLQVREQERVSFLLGGGKGLLQARERSRKEAQEGVREELSEAGVAKKAVRDRLAVSEEASRLLLADQVGPRNGDHLLREELEEPPN